MRRFLAAVAVCLLSFEAARAAKPTPQAAPTRLSGKAQIEALLQRPANIEIGIHETVSVGLLLSQISCRTGLSIRFDVPALANMYELEQEDFSNHTASNQSARQNLIARLFGRRHAAADTSKLAVNAASGNSVRQSAFYAPQASTLASPAPAPAILQVSGPAIGLVSSVVPATVPVAAPAKLNDEEGFVEKIESLQVNVQFVDLKRVTAGTVLRMALDAIPDGDAEDSSGLPLAISDATRPDFLVEDDCILITTRLKALTTKETRVYSLKNLHSINAQELSTAICQSVRPWSWRSRIDELGDQLKKSALEIPAESLLPLVTSEFNFETSKQGIELTAASTSNKVTGGDDLQQARMVGKALAGGLTAIAQTALNAAEVVHYADPPTGSIRVLGDKLIITQSQAAHREIAELLRQLSEE